MKIKQFTDLEKKFSEMCMTHWLSGTEKTHKEIHAMEYPYNLVYAVFGHENPGNLSKEDLIAEINIATSDLALKEQDVLKYRYQQNLTLQEVADVMGYSRERVRQAAMKLCRLLRHPLRGVRLVYTQEEIEQFNEKKKNR